MTSPTSPGRLGSLHGKSGTPLAVCKTILTDQHSRLANKHALDVELIEEMRTFIKAKCSIEKDYAQALIKLATSHQSKKYTQFMAENESESKTLYTAWKTYMDSLEQSSKNRLTQFDGFSPVCDNLKQMKSRKVQIGKKNIDQILKKMQEEVIASVTEIDKTKKAYFDEEHMAKQARDKEEKIKKRKAGIFSSFTSLQTKKEKTSAHREATDIQSTQARNDYIMALAAGNAHLNHFFALDLPALMQNMDDDVLDKCRGFLLMLLQSEINTFSMCLDSIQKSNFVAESSSADFTNAAFLDEPQSVCLKCDSINNFNGIREHLSFEFEPCDNDTVSYISLDHNADFALQHEVQKWMQWFTKDCRNLNKLSQQLVKCQTLLAEGHKTVEVQGSGPVDIEARIEDIKHQIRKCEISKLKAQARLRVIKESGLEMEDFENVEVQVTTEMKQLSLDVDIGQPLSRTPSLRSTNISTASDGGRLSSLDGKISDRSDDMQDTDKDQTPEPEMISNRLGRPESSSSDQFESPEPEQHQEYAYQMTSTWNDYDPATAWNDQAQTETEQPQEEMNYTDEYANYDQSYVPVDGTQIVGKICKTLYPYQSQTQDELSFVESETLTIIEGCDKDWVKAQNSRFMMGYVPAAYLEVIGDAPEDFVPEAIPQNPIPNPPENQDTKENESWLNDLGNVRALYDYTGSNEEELTFGEGDVIRLIDKSDDGWWTGEKDGIIGHFPSMLVEEMADNANEEIAFEVDSATESEESVSSPTTSGAPPAFAPPKPVHLTPHQVIITQPTPEIESRKQIGEEDEENNEINNNEEEQAEEITFVNPDFTLEKPKRAADENKEQDEEECFDEKLEFQEKMTSEMNGAEDNQINFKNDAIAEQDECFMDKENESAEINVKVIEETAEEISEAITNEAITSAVREVTLDSTRYYRNEMLAEESDSEDLK